MPAFEPTRTVSQDFEIHAVHVFPFSSPSLPASGDCRVALNTMVYVHGTSMSIEFTRLMNFAFADLGERRKCFETKVKHS
jgi:hypothetical protein